jgi:hypothetical protein
MNTCSAKRWTISISFFAAYLMVTMILPVVLRVGSSSQEARGVNMLDKTQYKFHSWQILITRYPSQEAKQLIKQGNWQVSDLEGLSARSSTVYYGWGERWASVRFYRACRDGLADPWWSMC